MIMIMHNDLHFNNIFVEKIDTPYLYEYTFLGITKMKKYKVLLYDHDRNYSNNFSDINKFINGRGSLCENTGTCNHYNNKDGYVLINNIYFHRNNIRNVIGELNFNNLFKIISNSDLTNSIDYARFELINMYKLTNIFCDWTVVSGEYRLNKTHCGYPDDNLEMNINIIMERYISYYKDKLFDNIDNSIINHSIHSSIYLSINEELQQKYIRIDSTNYFELFECRDEPDFYKKYLKYKIKYLLLNRN